MGEGRVVVVGERGERETGKAGHHHLPYLPLTPTRKGGKVGNTARESE